MNGQIGREKYYDFYCNSTISVATSVDKPWEAPFYLSNFPTLCTAQCYDIDIYCCISEVRRRTVLQMLHF